MSIMDMFRPKVVTPGPAATNPTVPGSAAALIDPSVNKDASPLAGFADLWKAEPSKDTVTSLVPSMKVDPAALMERAKTVDFLANVPKELFEKAVKGDGEALRAVVNHGTQAAYAQGALAAVEINKSNFADMQKKFEGGYLDGRVRAQQVAAELRSGGSKLFDDPAILPMLTMVEKQMQIANPTSTPQHIKELASDYLSKFAGAIVEAGGNKVTTPSINTGSKKEENWDSWDTK